MPDYTNDIYDIEKAFRAIEDELMQSMLNNLANHEAMEDLEGFEWSQWQVEQLRSLEKYKKANKKKFTSKFSDINKQIDVLISEARERGRHDEEIKILEAIRRGHIPRRKSSDVINKEFFKFNDRKLEALIKATQDDFKKAEIATLRQADDQYRQIIYNAQVYANTGAGTYAKAIDMATRNFLSRGITSIEYKNGARHTISDYAAMCLRTASKRAYLTGEGEKRQEWGEHLVIMNKRGNPCPLCLPFVGKILIDDVWSGGSAGDGNYPLMSYAIEKGLYHPRCRDGHTTYFQEIDNEEKTFTKKEIKDIENKYVKEQQKKHASRMLDKFSRLAKYSLDSENKEKYRAKIAQWKDIAIKQ